MRVTGGKVVSKTQNGPWTILLKRIPANCDIPLSYPLVIVPLQRFCNLKTWMSYIALTTFVDCQNASSATLFIFLCIIAEGPNYLHAEHLF